MKLPETPFWYLVSHFTRRMFSSEEETGSENVSLGIGAVLAMLASPGALTCFFLLEKYAHPRILIQGHRFDAYKFSGPDEYFLLVLSMTIIGLIMVLRWNRLFPDRRDFMNLASLPISSRDVFLANFVALIALAFLFAIVVNAVSWFLFPAVVTFADGSLSGFLRVALSHFAAVFSASLFSFFAVFAIVGVLMLITPKSAFRSVSVVVRVLLVVVLFTALLARPAANMQALPSVWFLGLYENIAGFASPALNHLGHRAAWALLTAVLVSIAAYSVCYRRHYLRLAESLDVIGSTRHRLRLPLSHLLFHSPFEHACASFAVKTLIRSERHVMFFGAYIGIGLVLVAQTSTAPSRSIPDSNVLAIPILISFFLITGLRFAFDIPAVLNANWLFRSAVEKPVTPLSSIARKLALAITLPWQVLFWAPLMLHLFGWRFALAHTLAVAVLTVFVIELLFARFRAVPFACRVEPDTQRFLRRILACVFALLIGVPLLAGLERWMLLRPLRFIPAALLLLIAWRFMESYKRDGSDPNPPPTFEDRAPSTFELLKLA